jgi:hypothetical protein
MFGKIVGACIIFLVLFFSAWIANNSHRGTNEVQQPITAEAIPINAVTNHMVTQPIEVFKPREYVKIKDILQ